MVEEEIVLGVEEIASNTGKIVIGNVKNNKCIFLYDWLVDSVTTVHVTNQREAFITYTPSNNATVVGVGDVKTRIEGHGDIKLESECEGTRFALVLKDVLSIPSNRNSLLSLGQWDQTGGSYKSHDGQMSLKKNGKTIIQGTKITNNLHKLNVKVHETETRVPNEGTRDLTLTTKEELPTWETWHKRYGHISYAGLKQLYQKDLVSGFKVNYDSPMPDCIACTEAKQAEHTYEKSITRQTKPGQLTHIDIWGKYDVTSINGHQYYVVLVDDAMRYITIEFLKGKNEAAQKVKNYLTHLMTHGKIPADIQVDRGKEFINSPLNTWCQEHGIEIQPTAPYTPSQNGVAERSNRTLVELMRAMIHAQNVPEFLWEYAVAHTAYLRNKAYTKILDHTPYQAWFRRKPNVAYLREFWHSSVGSTTGTTCPMKGTP
jgi:predicted RNA-binding protein Jag